MTYLAVICTLFFATAASAQTAETPAAKPAPPTTKSKTADKPSMDVDSFFKDIEDQIRKEQEKPGSCLPKVKPKEETSKPIA